jgi:hypothetical protein
VSGAYTRAANALLTDSMSAWHDNVRWSLLVMHTGPKSCCALVADEPESESESEFEKTWVAEA